MPLPWLGMVYSPHLWWFGGWFIAGFTVDRRNPSLNRSHMSDEENIPNWWWWNKKWSHSDSYSEDDLDGCWWSGYTVYLHMQILDDTRRWQIRVMRLGRRWNTIPVVPLKINQVWWLLGFLASSSVEFRCATQVLSCAQPKHQAGWSHPRAHPEVEGPLGLAVAVAGRSLTFMSTPLRPFPTSPTSSRTEMRCETKRNKKKLTMIWMGNGQAMECPMVP